MQFVDIILSEWTDELDATGVERLDPVPNNVCLVRMTNAQRDAVAGLDNVQWIGIYQPAYKVAPWLPMPLEGVSTLIVLTFPDADTAGLERQLQQWGGVIEHKSKGKLIVKVDLQFVVPIARLNGVMWIEPRVEHELHERRDK